MAVETVTRERLQARLDGGVRANRFTIAVVFPVVGAVVLVASAQGLLPPSLSFNPFLILAGTLVMRLPLVVGVLPVADRRTVGALAALAVYAYGIEYVGATTGWPYGAFSYGVDLGPMIAGTVPLGLPAFFFPLVVNSYLLVLLLFGDRADRGAIRLPAVVATVVAVDLVLDPGAVALGFWSYADGGAYYAVPWSNVAGWLLSASVATVLVDLAFDRMALARRVRTCEFVLDDLVSFVLLWGVINAFYEQWVAVALGGLFLAALFRIGRFDATLFRTVLPATG